MFDLFSFVVSIVSGPLALILGLLLGLGIGITIGRFIASFG